MEVANLLDIHTRAELYRWYLENHDKVGDFWLRVNRAAADCPGVVRYVDAVEVALCFGWIDSTQKKIDPGLLEELVAVHDIIHRYNAIIPSDTNARLAILKNLLGAIGDDEIIINQPFHCDYGKQIHVGRRFFANFNFTVLDEAPVTIGDNVWIGGSVTILPGVNIGNNVTIGAGSVVTKDIPDNVVAVGNPCRVIRKI